MYHEATGATFLLNEYLTTRTCLNWSVLISNFNWIEFTLCRMFSPILVAFWTEFSLALGTGGFGSRWFVLHSANGIAIWLWTPLVFLAQKHWFIFRQLNKPQAEFFIHKFFNVLEFHFAYLTLDSWTSDFGFAVADFMRHIPGQALKKNIQLIQLGRPSRELKTSQIFTSLQNPWKHFASM